jgi:hypothetical protein
VQPVVADRAPQRCGDQHRADQAGDGLGDVHMHADEHDRRQRADRPEGAMLQVAVGLERAAIHQHQREHGLNLRF